MVLIDENTRVIVQGITGKQGRFHTEQMLKYGTKIVAGVTPGKKGEEVHGVPVFNSIEEALKEQDADASIIFVPARYAKDAVIEAIEFSMNPIVVITEGIPVHDTMKFVERALDRGLRIIGPNTPGIIAPGKCKIGIMPSQVFKEGRIAVLSRSGTLTYEIAHSLSSRNLGQSVCIGIGGDPVIGTDFVDLLPLIEEDEETDAVVLIGEIGGNAEERASEIIEKMRKPVVGYIAGISAPPGKKMGHAGAIIERGGDALSKQRALEEAGARVARTPSEISNMLAEILRANG
ncbi:MAG: succinyl-CoA synthetase alpha subunit [Archaeoglobi archaeon]|nr:succinate--CoA ligase subunit alpha [Candidatus Mnemosynella bozhongmuii]MDK2781349.1 succinyl-CoA synthetase alpha subunit [Archaeoglobi archaeon]